MPLDYTDELWVRALQNQRDDLAEALRAAEVNAIDRINFMETFKSRAEAAETDLQAVMTRAEKAEQALDLANAHAKRLMDERDEWRNAMQELTPIGSEYTTPHECAAYIEEKMGRDIPRRIIEAEAERDEAQRQLAEAQTKIEELESDLEEYQIHEYQVVFPAGES